MFPFIRPRLINPPPPEAGPTCADYSEGFESNTLGDFTVTGGTAVVQGAAARTGSYGVRLAGGGTIRCTRNVCAGGTTVTLYHKIAAEDNNFINIKINGVTVLNSEPSTSSWQLATGSSLATGCIEIEISSNAGDLASAEYFIDDINITNNYNC